LIASPADLGSVTALWRQPQNYARFLGQELSVVYRGVLLVVMPNGYGLYHGGTARPVEQSALADTVAPGADLGTAALSAIQRLAAADGHRLAATSVATTTRSGPADVLSWVAFAIGCALIALAWTLSLRARPLRSLGTPG
jgi:hypothetical protein